MDNCVKLSLFLKYVVRYYNECGNKSPLRCCSLPISSLQTHIGYNYKR